jgi:phospholipase D1/2
MREIAAERPSVSHARDSYINDKGQEVLVSDVAAEGHGHTPKKQSSTRTRGRSNTVNTRTSGHSSLPEGYAGLPPPRMARMDTDKLGLAQLSQLPSLPVCDDTDIGGPPLLRSFSHGSASIINPLLADMHRPIVTEDCMRDPLSDSFFLDVWHAAAENNTKLFRQVFRCMPDNEVKTWKDYKEYTAFGERFSQSQGLGKSTARKTQETPGKTGPPGTGTVATTADRVMSIPGNMGKQVEALGERLQEKMTNHSQDEPNNKLGKVEQWAEEQEKRQQQQPSHPSLHLNTTAGATDEKAALQNMDNATVSPMNPPAPGHTFTFPPAPPIPDSEVTDFANTTGTRPRQVTISEPHRSDGTPNRAHASTMGSKRSRRRATTKSSQRQFHSTDDMLDKEDAKKVLDLVQGHLVLWPYQWLEDEEKNNGWLYTVDQIAPLEI